MLAQGAKIGCDWVAVCTALPWPYTACSTMVSSQLDYYYKSAGSGRYPKCNPLQITDCLLIVVISNGMLKLSNVILILSLTVQLLSLPNLYNMQKNETFIPISCLIGVI